MSPKPEIPQLGKSRDLATAIAAHNESIADSQYEPKIKVNQISTKGYDVFVRLTRRDGFKDNDVKFIMAMADSLGGTVNFNQTGEIIVNF